MKKYYRVITDEYNRHGDPINQYGQSYEGFDIQKALNAYDRHERNRYYNLFDVIEVCEVPDNFEELDIDEQIELTLSCNSLEIPNSDSFKTSPKDILYYAFDENGRELITTKNLEKAIDMAKAAKGWVEKSDAWDRIKTYLYEDYSEEN